MSEPRRVLDGTGKAVWTGEGEDVAAYVAQCLTNAEGIEHRVSRPTEWVEASSPDQHEPIYIPCRYEP